MRFVVTLAFVTLLLTDTFAQSGRRPKIAIFSASSEWQQVTLKPLPPVKPPEPARKESVTPVQRSSSTIVERTQPVTSRTPVTMGTAEFRPAFTGDFATNRNGWRAGNQGDYYYQIGLGQYSIRRRIANTQQLSFSAVELPNEINLNAADLYTIKVDMLADSGQVPAGGLLFGVRDSLNYNAFLLNAKGEVAVVRVADGRTFSDYMPADFLAPGVSVEKNRNRLTVQRRGNALHFYINAQEIRSSPYPVRLLAGNGIGFTSSAYWTAFQKLTVTLGL
ncbi:hypothetical protein [Spirosoma linguale]|uniref:Uncharacterized protein n=1 Tax=Spirosoma linguale (strain ATCC 33905 / DSM 74 / LMG 10896 / Claus 1) TaxID=504472 RepID=D2QND1_SPILD|nr:hypothetical protein Slin_3309 [Spirosoma linguale DSM 74]